MDKSMAVVRAVRSLADGASDEFRMYAFLVTVDGMEVCEAFSLAYSRPLRHGLSGCASSPKDEAVQGG